MDRMWRMAILNGKKVLSFCTFETYVLASTKIAEILRCYKNVLVCRVVATFSTQLK